MAERTMMGVDEGAAPLLGDTEAQYQLASRLVDYMRLGEAIRILESLGDYKNSRELLRETLAIKAYADAEEEKRREEERRQRERRAEEERRADRKWRNRLIIGGVVMVVMIILLVSK